MVRRVTLVGAGMGLPGTLTADAARAVRESALVLGAPRLIEGLGGLCSPGAELVPLVRAAEIADAVERSEADSACVLLSGDVGFHSGARLVRDELQRRGVGDVRTVPGVPSVAYLCARLAVPWQDVHQASAHGRDCDPAAEVRAHGTTFFVAGGALKAHDLCALLAEAGLSDALVHVGERLSYDDELIVSGTAAELAGRRFDDLAVLLVEDPMPVPRPGSHGDGAPRLMVAASASGGGKTTFACGLMRALVGRGLRVQACKCGPDYIDPLFHREAVGVPSRNLDLFFMDEVQARGLLALGAAQADVTVMEGAMGYYDGIAFGDRASAWHVARATGTPAVLVVDGRKRALSLAAEVAGLVRFRERSNVAGVVVNRVPERLYSQLERAIRDECGVPALGYLPEMHDCGFESRHLGLVTAAEVAGVSGKLDRIAAAVENCVDVDGLLEVARSAEGLEAPVADGPDGSGSAERGGR